MSSSELFYQRIQKMWPQLTKPFECSSVGRSVWQLVNTLVPFFGLMVLMYYSLSIHYGLTLLLSVLTAGFWLRIFILFHDCCHQSFFSSRRANDVFGFLLGVLVFTPYRFWKKSHAIHHANNGKLEGRGIGDVATLTVQEYLQRSTWKRFTYRLYRNPVLQFVFAPVIYFSVFYRFSQKYARTWRRERRSIYATNACLALILSGLVLLVGWKSVVLILLPTFMMTTGVGVWLFYVQHQFEYAYWAVEKEWDYVKAALKGASHYRLPKVFHWLTGNIGFHHVHHLNPRIPNYRLPACYKANDFFHNSPSLGFFESFKTMFLALWDEEEQKMISFSAFKRGKVVVS
jgi:acyl-lipid omega-6 desaturase (Delta-12 desaturase)